MFRIFCHLTNSIKNRGKKLVSVEERKKHKIRLCSPLTIPDHLWFYPRASRPMRSSGSLQPPAHSQRPTFPLNFCLFVFFSFDLCTLCSRLTPKIIACSMKSHRVYVFFCGTNIVFAPTLGLLFFLVNVLNFFLLLRYWRMSLAKFLFPCRNCYLSKIRRLHFI